MNPPAPRPLALLLLALTPALGTRWAGAQSVVAPGTRVRVHVAGGEVSGAGGAPANPPRYVGPWPDRWTGRLVRATPDTLVVATAWGNVAVPAGVAARVEVSRGRPSRVGAGAGLGLVAGALAGYATAYFGTTDHYECEGFECLGPALVPRRTLIAGGTIIGGLLGAGVGAVVGVAVSRERWAPASAPVTVGVLRPHANGRRPHPALSVRVPAR